MLDKPRRAKRRRGAVPRGPRICDHCGLPDGEGRVLLPIGPYGSAGEVHVGCYQPWLAGKRERGELPQGP